MAIRLTAGQYYSSEEATDTRRKIDNSPEDTTRNAKEDARAAKITDGLGSSLSALGRSLGDATDLDSDTEFAITAGVQGAGLGLSTAAALAGTGVGAPVGAAIALFSVIGAANSRRRREEAQRRQAEKAWNKAKENYEKEIGKIKGSAKKTETQIEKEFGRGATLDIQKQAKRDAAIARNLDQASRGVKAVSAQDAVKDINESVEALVKSADDTLLTRIDKLDEIQNLAQAEIDADRYVLGAIKTSKFKELETALEEYEDIF